MPAPRLKAQRILEGHTQNGCTFLSLVIKERKLSPRYSRDVNLLDFQAGVTVSGRYLDGQVGISAAMEETVQRREQLRGTIVTAGRGQLLAIHQNTLQGVDPAAVGVHAHSFKDRGFANAILPGHQCYPAKSGNFQVADAAEACDGEALDSTFLGVSGITCRNGLRFPPSPWAKHAHSSNNLRWRGVVMPPPLAKWFCVDSSVASSSPDLASSSTAWATWRKKVVAPKAVGFQVGVHAGLFAGFPQVHQAVKAVDERGRGVAKVIGQAHAR